MIRRAPDRIAVAIGLIGAAAGAMFGLALDALGVTFATAAPLLVGVWVLAAAGYSIRRYIHLRDTEPAHLPDPPHELAAGIDQGADL